MQGAKKMKYFMSIGALSSITLMAYGSSGADIQTQDQEILP